MNPMSIKYPKTHIKVITNNLKHYLGTMTKRGKEKKWPRSQFVTSTHCQFCIISWVYFNIHYQFVIPIFTVWLIEGVKVGLKWEILTFEKDWDNLCCSFNGLCWRLWLPFLASMIMRTTINVYCMHVFMCMNGTLPIHGYIMHDHLDKVNGSLSILEGPYFGQKYSISEPYMLDMYAQYRI